MCGTPHCAPSPRRDRNRDRHGADVVKKRHYQTKPVENSVPACRIRTYDEMPSKKQSQSKASYKPIGPFVAPCLPASVPSCLLLLSDIQHLSFSIRSVPRIDTRQKTVLAKRTHLTAMIHKRKQECPSRVDVRVCRYPSRSFQPLRCCKRRFVPYRRMPESALSTCVWCKLFFQSKEFQADLLDVRVAVGASGLHCL